MSDHLPASQPVAAALSELFLVSLRFSTPLYLLELTRQRLYQGHFQHPDRQDILNELGSLHRLNEQLNQVLVSLYAVLTEEPE